MLSKNDYTALLAYRNGSVSASITEESPHHMNLCQQGFIEAASYGEDAFQVYVSTYQLTPQGENALCEYEQCQDSTKTATHRFWISIVIPNALATVAIILSLIALVKSL